MPVVADASALAAVLFAEAEASSVSARLHGLELVAVSLLPYELANAAVRKVRRGEMTAADAGDALTALEALAVGLQAIDAAAVYELALSTGLTAYDASYLWLARQLKADLVTLDTKLEKAWLKDKLDDGETNS